MDHTQLIPVVPGIKHDFLLSTVDFNSNGQLPASTLLKYATDARWSALATWPAFAKMMQDEPGVDVVAKVHMIRFLRPNQCIPASLLQVTQTPHAVGATTMTLAYEFSDDRREVFAQVLTICHRMKDGTPLPLPEYVSQELVWRHRCLELENTTNLSVLSDAIEATEVVSNKNRLSHEVLVRPSDTDRRKIVKHSRMAQFFEDAFPSGKVPDLLYLEILSELRAKSWCDLISVPNKENGGSEVISLLVDRDSGKNIARSYVSWISKVIQDGPY